MKRRGFTMTAGPGAPSPRPSSEPDPMVELLALAREPLDLGDTVYDADDAGRGHDPDPPVAR